MDGGHLEVIHVDGLALPLKLTPPSFLRVETAVLDETRCYRKVVRQGPPSVWEIDNERDPPVGSLASSQLHFGAGDAPPQKAKQRKWEARKEARDQRQRARPS